MENFLSYVINDLRKHGVSLHLIAKNSHKKCFGYFDEKTVLVCLKNEDWLDTLVHEYCHFLQKKDNPKQYEKVFGGKNKKDFYKNACKIEIDCAIRSLKIIKKFNLKINKPYFIRSSNFNNHIYFYYDLFEQNGFKKMPNNDFWDLNRMFTQEKILDFNRIWFENLDVKKEISKYLK